MTDYLITTDKKVLEKYQQEADAQLGYPESLESLRYIGGGIHAPKDIGRVMHYQEILEDKDNLRFALPVVATKETPHTVTVCEKALPEDWYDIEPLIVETEEPILTRK